MFPESYRRFQPLLLRQYISKRNSLRSGSPRSPCAPNVPGAYNVNCGSGHFRRGRFCPEVQGSRPMRRDGQVSVWMHWTWPFGVLTHWTLPGAATPLILYRQRPASSSLRSQCTGSHAALCGRLAAATSLLPASTPNTPAYQLSFHDTLSSLTLLLTPP